MKRNDFYRTLARYLPLGIPPQATFRRLCTIFGTAIALTLAAPLCILAQYDHLYYKEGGKKIFYDGLMMPMFSEITLTWFVFFAAILLGCVGVAVFFYLYHRQGSMSIYTMRRLPDRWDLHRRCLTLPLAAAVLAVTLAALLLALYYAFYLWLVPPAHITPGQIPFLISELTGGIF